VVHDRQRSGESLQRFGATPKLLEHLASGKASPAPTESQFTMNMQNGGGLALAPKQNWAGGLSGRHVLGPGEDINYTPA
jgi:hypothetical protein